ncbi:MAG: hypothetical protein JNK05_05570 [Myxococcales bacterium]|nr:hypothetical protein [Myxococcales bacterium]
MNRSSMRAAALSVAIASSAAAFSAASDAHAFFSPGFSWGVSGVFIGSVAVIPALVTTIGTIAYLPSPRVPLGWSVTATVSGALLSVGASCLLASDLIDNTRGMMIVSIPSLVFGVGALTLGTAAIALKGPRPTLTPSDSARRTTRLPALAMAVPWFSSNAAGLSTGFRW